MENLTELRQRWGSEGVAERRAGRSWWAEIEWCWWFRNSFEWRRLVVFCFLVLCVTRQDRGSLETINRNSQFLTIYLLFWRITLKDASCLAYHCAVSRWDCSLSDILFLSSDAQYSLEFGALRQLEQWNSQRSSSMLPNVSLAGIQSELFVECIILRPEEFSTIVRVLLHCEGCLQSAFYSLGHSIDVWVVNCISKSSNS